MWKSAKNAASQAASNAASQAASSAKSAKNVASQAAASAKTAASQAAALAGISSTTKQQPDEDDERQSLKSSSSKKSSILKALPNMKNVSGVFSGSSSSSSKGGSSAFSSCSKEVILKKVEQAHKTRVLVLRECGLKVLPKESTQESEFEDLRTADLTCNRLKTLPPEIQVWINLETLNVSDNCLEQLPVTISTLSQLRKLTLSRNRLKILPAEIGNMRLSELHCDSNDLSLLPNVFGGDIAETLEELDVSGNRLEALPSSLGSLRVIVRLLTQENKALATLSLQPQSEGCLSKLQSINAADNNIREVPSEIFELPALSELWLKGNPMDRLVLQQIPGFEKFAERRKQRLDQKIDQHVVGEVDLSMCGLQV